MTFLSHLRPSRDTAAAVLAVALGLFAIATSVAADLHAPAARFVAIQCKGFGALATVGAKPIRCDTASSVAERRV